MKTPSRFPWSVKLLALAAVLLLGAGVAAQAQDLCAMTGSETLRTDQPSYSRGQAVRLMGSGYAANCSVTVQAILPDGGFDTNTATTGPDGSLSFSYAPAANGSYSVDVIGAENLGLTSASFRNGPEVVTDKGDYHPGETVTVTGSHFQPGEPISLRVREDSSAVADRLFSAIADSNGDFVNAGFVPGAEDAQLNFTLTAAGQLSGLVAETQFKDSFATITFIKNVAVAAHGSGSFSSFTVNVPAAGVAAGHSVIAAAILGGSTSPTGTIGCSDTKGNTYSVDVNTKVASNTYQVICSAHNVAALTGTDTITMTFFTTGNGGTISVNEFSGLAPSGAKDQSAFASSTTGPISSGLTPAVAQTNELVFGLIHASTFTLATTGSSPAETYASAPNNDPYHLIGTAANVWPMYRIVGASLPRQYEANGTGSGGGLGGWRAAVVTYKAATTYTLTYTAGANGTISGTSPQTVGLGGSGTAVTAQPNTGYHFVNWSDTSTTNPRQDTNVTADVTVTANFAINTFTLTYAAGANGLISGSASQTVNYGTNGSAVTADPSAGYHFTQWSDGSTANPRTDSNVTSNLSFTASFAINTYTLTYTGGANGTISGTTPQTVNSGASGTAVTAVADAGYHFVSWSDGAMTASRTDSNVTANVSVTASFAINTYTLTYTAGANGTITGTSSQTVNHGASGTAVTAVADAGYHFVSWSDGAMTASRTDSNVTANLSVTASFAINTYTLTYTAGSNGTITGASSQTVNSGASGTAVTAVPNSGYHFVSWSDGVMNASRTDSNVTANLSVTATFAINTYTLGYTAGPGGSLSGTTSQTVNSGGSGSAVTAAPNTGYSFVQWSDGSTANPRTDSNVTANVSVTATFAINTYTLTYAAGANGSISGTSSQAVAFGGSGSAVTAVPSSGYHFTQWSDGSTTNPRTDSNVTASLSVTASFDVNAPTDTQAPVTSNTVAQPVPMNTGSLLTASITDVNTGNSDIASAWYSLDGGAPVAMTAADLSFNSPTEAVKATIPGFTTTGVHTVCVWGVDSASNNGAQDCAFLAVYDPSAGFVTGGGWIMSPAGAMPDNPTATGKANFGFNSKYVKGKTVPEGDTQFQFQAGSLNFHSMSYEWMVISSYKAQYYGVGTINGSGSYSFILTAIDGAISGGGGTDKFRIKIYADNQGNGLIYDNLIGQPDSADPTTTLGGGSIVIHK